MSYVKLREILLKIKEDGELINGIKLDKATTVTNASKFIDSHILYLDKQQKLKEKRRKINSSEVKRFYQRLVKYHDELKIKAKK